MKASSLLLFLFLSAASYADADADADVVAEQCVATFIFEGHRTDVMLWKGMFSLNTDTIIRFLVELEQLEDADELPHHLVAEAIDLCRDIFEHVQSQSVASPP